MKKIWVSLAMVLCALETRGASLSASLVSEDITPPTGVSLAGFGGGGRRGFDALNLYPYATYLKPSTGVLDPIQSKVLMLRSEGKNLVFISVDLIGASRRMRKDIAVGLKILGIKEEEIFYSGTHTHSGPGTFEKNWLWELIAADKYQSDIYNHLVARITHSVWMAFGGLRPATLHTFSFQTQGITENRNKKPNQFDPQANMLIVKDQRGAIMGGIVNFAIHGTVLGGDNLEYSGDVNSHIATLWEDELETINKTSFPKASRPVALFINGAEGDVGPLLHGAPALKTLSEKFVQDARPHINEITPVSGVWDVKKATVNLRSPRFNVRACLHDSFFLLRWLAQGANLFVKAVFPSKTDIYSIKLGHILMMTWPGEPTTSLGLELKALAQKAGASAGWVLGLTNDHLAYFTNPTEYKEDFYEACTSLYGEDGGSLIVEAHRQLLGVPNVP